LAYPLRIENGNLAVKTDYDLKAQEIRSVLETRFFERVMRADYGTNDFTLEVIDPGLINSSIEDAIRKNVFGLSSLSVTGDWITQGEDGVYKVIVMFSVNGVPQPPVNFSLSS
jgi:hypothetical protein